MKAHTFYVDTVLQAFDSDENVAFLLGAKSGDIDVDGKDIVEATVSLIIPNSRALEFAENVSKGIEAILLKMKSSSKPEASVVLDAPNKGVRFTETLSAPIAIRAAN